MMDRQSPELVKLIAAILGSTVAIRWIDGPWYWRAVAWACGVFAAYTAAAPVTIWLQASEHWIGVAGLVLGMLAMSIAGKVMALIDAIDVREIARAVVDAIKRRIGP